VKAATNCVSPLLVGLLTSLSCPAETPGRLFFTPEERRLLEQAGQPQQESAPERNDGFLLTPGGQRTQWMDGNAHETPLPIPIGDSRQKPLLPAGSVLRHRPEDSP